MNTVELLNTVKNTISDRELQYGDSETCCNTIAKFWNVYLQAKGWDCADLAGHDVAAMMRLMKMARVLVSERPSDDCFIDMIGYACLEYDLRLGRYKLKV